MGSFDRVALAIRHVSDRLIRSYRIVGSARGECHDRIGSKSQDFQFRIGNVRDGCAFAPRSEVAVDWQRAGSAGSSKGTPPPCAHGPGALHSHRNRLAQHRTGVTTPTIGAMSRRWLHRRRRQVGRPLWAATAAGETVAGRSAGTKPAAIKQEVIMGARIRNFATSTPAVESGFLAAGITVSILAVVGVLLGL